MGAGPVVRLPWRRFIGSIGQLASRLHPDTHCRSDFFALDPPPLAIHSPSRPGLRWY
jgi:hypothetical protein